MLDQALLDAIAQHYLSSGDFNGYSVRRLRREFKLETREAKTTVERLLLIGKIEVLFGNVHPNPHIKAFSNISNEAQLRFLAELEFTDHICLFPSREFLATLSEVERFKASPFAFELALGAGQLDFRAFDLSVLEHYRNDPRYYYETNFIGGSISIRDECFKPHAMPRHDQVLLQTLGFAYDDKLNRAVAVFLRYLSKLSPEHQRIWEAKKLEGSYKLHPDYYRSSILGEWGTRISIFEAFTQELDVINEMSTLMDRPPLFRETFNEDRPKEFGFLLRPTLSAFHEFVLLLDKMMSDNINKEFFATDLSLEEDEERADGKILVRQKGTVALLEEWIGKYVVPSAPGPVREMFKGFRNVRKLRQKPAHAINDDIFDLRYFKEQRELVIAAYQSVRTLRLVLANHPNVTRKPPKIGKHLQLGEIWDI